MRIKASIDIEDFIGALVDRYIQPLLSKVDHMSQQITDLQTATTALTSQATAAIAVESALKQKLDAAIAANSTLTAANVDLASKLAAAQANAGDPADASAIAGVTASLAQTTQALSDANAVNAPSN